MYISKLKLRYYLTPENPSDKIIGVYKEDLQFKVGDEMTVIMPLTDENLYIKGLENKQLKVKVVKQEIFIYPLKDGKILIRKEIEDLMLKELLPIEEIIKTGLTVKNIYLEAEDRDYMIKESEKIRKINAKKE